MIFLATSKLCGAGVIKMTLEVVYIELAQNIFIFEIVCHTFILYIYTYSQLPHMNLCFEKKKKQKQ